MLLLIILLSIIQIYGATIEGIVTDSRTGEPLIGANVTILNTNIGAGTNNEGYYIIKDLFPGKYIIRTSYIVYSSHTDSINITGYDERVRLNIRLKSPIVDLDSVSNPELEAYHEKLHEMSEDKPIININIDSLRYSNGYLTAYISMTNVIGETIFVFKNYSCFNVLKPIVIDSTGKTIKRNMIMIDCVGEKTCPDPTDLIQIKPGATIKYPITKLEFYNFTKIPKGKYTVKIKYEFKKPEEINTFYCRGNSVIKTLIKGLRGTYVSSNELTFINR
jgi:hypothetical protein